MQAERRINATHRAINKPLTILGAERKLASYLGTDSGPSIPVGAAEAAGDQPAGQYVSTHLAGRSRTECGPLRSGVSMYFHKTTSRYWNSARNNPKFKQ